MPEESWPDTQNHTAPPDVEVLTPEQWEALVAGLDDGITAIGNAELIRRVKGSTIGPRVLRRILDVEGALNVANDRTAWYKQGTELARVEIDRLRGGELPTLTCSQVHPEMDIHHPDGHTAIGLPADGTWRTEVVHRCDSPMLGRHAWGETFPFCAERGCGEQRVWRGPVGALTTGTEKPAIERTPDGRLCHVRPGVFRRDLGSGVTDAGT